jgi:hypothetical protein
MRCRSTCARSRSKLVRSPRPPQDRDSRERAFHERYPQEETALFKVLRACGSTRRGQRLLPNSRATKRTKSARVTKAVPWLVPTDVST